MRKISGLLLGIAAISMVSYLSAGITIIEAKYGKLNDKKKTKNVTSTLQSLVDGEDQFTINAGEYNKLFGDPAKKKAKQFYVKYNDGKNTHEKTVSDKESISFVAIRIALPPQPKPEVQPKPASFDIPDELFVSNGISVINNTNSVARIEVIYRSSDNTLSKSFSKGIVFASENKIDFEISGEYKSISEDIANINPGNACTLTFDPEKFEPSGYIAIVISGAKGYTYSGGTPYGLPLKSSDLGKAFILQEDGNCYLIDKDGNKSNIYRLTR